MTKCRRKVCNGCQCLYTDFSTLILNSDENVLDSGEVRSRVLGHVAQSLRHWGAMDQGSHNMLRIPTHRFLLFIAGWLVQMVNRDTAHCHEYRNK